MTNKVKILLIVSLCLNIFLLGFAARDVKRFVKPHKGGDFSIMREFMQDRKEAYKEINEEKKVAMDMLKASELDKEAFEAQVNKISDLQNKMYKEFAINMADKMMAMPADERAKTIEKMEKRREGFKKHFNKRFHRKGKMHKDVAPETDAVENAEVETEAAE